MKHIIRKKLPLTLVTALILSPVTFSMANAAAKSLPDLEGPVIEHAPPADSLQKGDPVTISAKVTDNVGVKSVILNYRLSGTQNYQQIDMTALGSSLFNGTIPAIRVSIGTMEYYIEATDLSGNTVLRGLNFSPLTFAIKAPQVTQPVIAQPAPSQLKTEKKSNSWIWWAVGAVVAGGATYALTRDSGGDGPSTGTIIISSPQPE